MKGEPMSDFAKDANVPINDYISRQAAIDEIKKCRFIVDAIEKIRGLPSTADVRENVRGEWQVTENIENDCYIVRCSNCHASVRVGSRILYDAKIELNNYCPNCGADMRGDKNE